MARPQVTATALHEAVLAELKAHADPDLHGETVHSFFISMKLFPAQVSDANWTIVHGNVTSKRMLEALELATVQVQQRYDVMTVHFEKPRLSGWTTLESEDVDFVE